MCQSKYLSLPIKKAGVSKELNRTDAGQPCKLRDSDALVVQNADFQPALTRPFLAGVLLIGLLLLSGPLARGVTLAELRADSTLTPERFIKSFADFKFELSRTVRKPEVFVESKIGDCDDFATLAAELLHQKGYTTRLVAVYLPKDVHVVCYVAETNSYLDYNCRKKVAPLVKCDGKLATIASCVAESFRTQWRSVSEFTFHNGIRRFVMTEFR
jgi:hypothetical protein